jgi:hypothetical protein
MKKLKYISAQPASVYYSWQLQTMIHSFVSNGVAQEDIIVLFSGREKSPVSRLMNKFPNVEYLFFDVNPDIRYLASNKPYLMWKYFSGDNSRRDEQYFYCDSDVILTKPLPGFDNENCYVSDTVSYLGYDYIVSKGEDVLDLMCSVVGIDKNIVKENAYLSGGAQYVFYGTDADFWKNVYHNSIKLYFELNDFNIKNRERYKGKYPIQQWTAEMWATTWEFWKRGIKTIVSKELNFAWATDNISKMENVGIMHNAGVTSSLSKLFRKYEWINSYPPNNLIIDNLRCSHYYYETVKEAIYNE